MSKLVTQPEVEAVERVLSTGRLLTLMIQFHHHIGMRPVIHAEVCLAIAAVYCVARPVIPAAAASEHAPLFREFPGRFHVPAILSVCTGGLGAAAVQTPSGIERAQAECTFAQNHMCFTQSRGTGRGI